VRLKQEDLLSKRNIRPLLDHHITFLSLPAKLTSQVLIQIRRYRRKRSYTPLGLAPKSNRTKLGNATWRPLLIADTVRR